MPRALTDQERDYIRNGLKTAALNMVAERGIRKTTVDDLVNEVRIPKGTFYLFYKSKEELVFEALEEVHDRLQAHLVEQMKGLAQDLSEEKTVDAFFGFFQLVDETKLAQFIVRGDFELLIRKLPEEKVNAHFLKDSGSMDQLLPLFPAAESLDKEALEGAFRGLFLLLLHKKEIGGQNFDASLKLMLRGLVRQMFET